MKEIFWKLSFLILFLIWFFIRMPYSRKSKKIGIKIKKQINLERLLVILNFVSMMFLPLFVVFRREIDFATMGTPSFIRWLALSLYAFNLIFFLWCHKHLDKNWSNVLEIKKDHRLIQTGPYKKIRHPMYTHFWILIISQGFFLNSWIVLSYGILAWGVLYFLRVKKEEEMMIEEFGEEYKEYMKKTGRLFPKILK